MTPDPALLAEVRDLDQQRTAFAPSAMGNPLAANQHADLTARLANLAPLLTDEVERLHAELAHRNALDLAWNEGASTARGVLSTDPTAEPHDHIPDHYRADEELAGAWMAGWAADAAIVGLDEARAQLDAFEVYRALTTGALGIDPRSCADDVREAIEELQASRPRPRPAPPPAEVWVLRERPGRNPIPVLTFDTGDAVEFWTDDSACEWGEARWCPIPKPEEL